MIGLGLDGYEPDEWPRIGHCLSYPGSGGGAVYSGAFPP